MEEKTIEQRLDSLEIKISVIMDSLEKNFELIDANFKILDSRISSLQGETNQNFGEVKEELKKIQYLTGYSEQLENTKGLP